MSKRRALAAAIALGLAAGGAGADELTDAIAAD